MLLVCLISRLGAVSISLTWVSAPLAAERAIEVAAALIDLARIENKVPSTVPRQKICFDEWNVWDMFRARGEDGAEERWVSQAKCYFHETKSNQPMTSSYTLSDALAVGVWLNVFIRQSKNIGMANIAQSVNVISPLMTSETGITKQSTWWPLFLFSKYMRGSTLAVHLRCGVYDGPTRPEWIRGTLDTPWLDVSAAIDDEGKITLAVVNISADKDIEAQIDGISSLDVAEVYTVSAGAVEATNTDGESEVLVEGGTWNGGGRYSFPKHSLTMLRWQPAT